MRLIKARSQVFLRDHTIITTIVDYVSAHNRFVFEIGCGGGALTIPLVKRQVRLVGVETDQRWWAVLRVKLSSFANTLILHQDVLRTDLALTMQQYFPAATPVTIVSNLPYHLSKKIIFQLLKVTSVLPRRIDRWVLMMQSELADRFLARVGESSYGFLSVIFGHFFTVEQLLVVPRCAFVPRPGVDSKVVVFHPHRRQLTRTNPALVVFIRQLFRFRRKTVNNNLKRVVKPLVWRQMQALSCAKLQLRPQNLTFNDFVELFAQVSSFKL